MPAPHVEGVDFSPYIYLDGSIDTVRTELTPFEGSYSTPRSSALSASMNTFLDPIWKSATHFSQFGGRDQESAILSNEEVRKTFGKNVLSFFMQAHHTFWTKEEQSTNSDVQTARELCADARKAIIPVVKDRLFRLSTEEITPAKWSCQEIPGARPRSSSSYSRAGCSGGQIVAPDALHHAVSIVCGP